MSLKKEDIEQIVLEELHEILGLGKLFRGKEKKKSGIDASANEFLTSLALDDETHSQAKNAKVSGYKNLASKTGRPAGTIRNSSYSLEEEQPDDFDRFADLPGYEDERVPGKTASQVKRRDMPEEEPAPSYRDDLYKYLEEGEGDGFTVKKVKTSMGSMFYVMDSEGIMRLQSK